MYDYKQCLKTRSKGCMVPKLHMMVQTYVATQLRKKMRAYDSATTTLVPEAPMATGACSREDPQPKLSPAITIGYSVFMEPSWMYLRAVDSESHDLLCKRYIPLWVEVVWQANQCVAAKLLVLVRLRWRMWHEYANCSDKLHTLDGTKVKYSAGMIWSVSMFCEWVLCVVKYRMRRRHVRPW